MGKLSSPIQLMVYIQYWLLFFENDNFKYTTTSPTSTFNSFSLFCIFISHHFLSYYLFSNSHAHHVYNLYHISHALRFCYVMYYILSKLCIGEPFLEDCFYWYSQQIIYDVANESLIPYNLIKRTPETQKL